MPKFRPHAKRPPEDPALTAEARRIGEQLAIEAFGPEGFCRQVVRRGATREFLCDLAHQPGKPGELLGKTVFITVPE